VTVLLEAPAASRTSAVTHSIDAGHYDTTGERIPLQVSVQLPARYLAVLLWRNVNDAEDIATVAQVRQMVAILLVSETFRAMEDTAYFLKVNEPYLAADDAAWLATCRVKVAEAFPGSDPWAI
jgi:hypothetical protein